MTSSDRFVGFRSCEEVKQLHEACLIGITHWGFAIWLDPFGMLAPQVLVDPLPELGIGVNLVMRGNWLGGFKYGARRRI